MAPKNPQPFTKIGLVREELDKTPHITSRGLARVLKKKWPKVFGNENATLKMVMTARGANGKITRHRSPPNERHVRSKQESDACQRWGAYVPESDKSNWEVHELPDTVSKWLILCDIHFPHHDRQAVCTALEHARDNCDGVLLLGDIIDFYQISKFQRDPRERNVDGKDGEIEMVKRFLEGLQTLKPKAIVWKSGNHEMRLPRYLMQNNPEMWRYLAENCDIPHIFSLPQLGVTWIKDNDIIRHHALSILHGHEWHNRNASPVNPARGAFLKAHACTLQGHEHKRSEHGGNSILDDRITCKSIGCLCGLHPTWKPLNEWDHGFAYLIAGSEWEIENYKIINGSEVKL